LRYASILARINGYSAAIATLVKDIGVGSIGRHPTIRILTIKAVLPVHWET
jgi:hypothetical protein